MIELLLASGNAGKLREIRALLHNRNIQLLVPQDVGLQDLHVTEDGQTYAENAAHKAQAFCAASGLPSLADDSGLEVGALNGAPGLHSARYSPKPHATDADRRAYLLTQLSKCPKPWLARFYCVIALAVPKQQVQFAEGICPGEIISIERGQDGFGYDPIFWLPAKQKTMAELSMEEKNTLSHRAHAVMSALPLLQQLCKNGSS